MNTFAPRQGQREILEYTGGMMAVSAVPGSGKTATIAALTAKLLTDRAHASGWAGPLEATGRILIVTYQNAAVDHLRARIRHQLSGTGLPQRGYDIRTLHGLAYSIVQSYPGQAGTTTDFRILDDRTRTDLLDRAVGQWSEDHEAVWRQLAPEQTSAAQKWDERWLGIGRSLAAAVLRTAKNRRLSPGQIAAALSAGGAETRAGKNEVLFLRIGTEISQRYQQLAETMGGLDFDDLIRLAVDVLERHGDLTTRLARRWNVVLEDEAQDSSPLQEELLGMLTAERRHWVRVGDPNQAIMSSFTSADPRHLRRFMNHPQVTTVEMSVSGRCSPPIMAMANHLVEWVCGRHPVSEVREQAFRPQRIVPTGQDDPQQNPAAAESRVIFREYDHLERELADVARRATEFTAAHPEMTVAILVAKNRTGYDMADELRQCGADFDERLQTSRSSRRVTDALASALEFVGTPLRSANLDAVFRALSETVSPPPSDGRRREDGDDAERARTAETAESISRLLRSCYRPETLLYPRDGEHMEDALPRVGEIAQTELAAIGALANRLRSWLGAATLPVDQFTMTMAQDVVAEEHLPRAQQVAAYLRRKKEQNPLLRLPELAAELSRGAGGALGEGTAPQEPQPGTISLTTLHRSKGLEWDLVYAVGLDGDFFPNTLEDRFPGEYDFLGGDPTEMARAALEALCDAEFSGSTPSAPGPEAPGRSLSPTDIGHIDVICERLRLLYVAITRARRFLSLSWSREIPAQGMRTRAVNPSLAFQALAVYQRSERQRR